MGRVNLCAVFCVAALLHLHFSDGKIKSRGNWNRRYPDFNISLFTFFDIIAECVNNETELNGHGITLSTADFYVNGKLFGVNVTGDVYFQNPYVTNFGNISRTLLASTPNHSPDDSFVTTTFGIRVANLSFFYDLHANLLSGNVDGTIEVLLAPYVDFIFDFVHVFETKENKATPVEIYMPEQTHKFQPRTQVIYAIETLTDNTTGVDSWYGPDLLKWQKEKLAPMVVKCSANLVFPVAPNYPKPNL